MGTVNRVNKTDYFCVGSVSPISKRLMSFERQMPSNSTHNGDAHFNGGPIGAKTWHSCSCELLRC